MEKNRLNLKYPTVVEGKYDKIKLSAVVATPIITLGGFSAFNSAEKKDELEAFAKAGGLIVLTDSDKAGTFIRGRLKSLLPGCELVNVYAPAVKGKDNRRNHTNKEGVLGVESADCDALYEILKPLEGNTPPHRFLDRQKAYADGVCGRAESSKVRIDICRRLSLPENLTAGLLIEYINNFITKKEYDSIINKDNQ